MVVIDNLLNMNTGDAGDFAALIDSLSALHSLARAKDVAVLVLHHVNVRDGQRAHDYPHPITLSVVMAQYGDDPVLASLPEEPAACCLREAQHATPSPSGEDYATVYVDAPRMTFYDGLAEMKTAEKMREYT